MSDEKLEKEVAALLLQQPRKKRQWQFLESAEKEEREADKQEANKFLFWCVMSKLMTTKKVRQNTIKILEDCQFLKNPSDLWAAILGKQPTPWGEWWANKRFHDDINMAKYHCDNAHTILTEYKGDARNLWRHGSRCEIDKRLQKLRGIALAISNMTIGALRDTRQIDLPWSDVKPDRHVCRVLSRVFQNCDEFYTPQEIVDLTRRMHKEDPWQLDQPLFYLGKNVCTSIAPDCDNCYLKEVCKGRRKQKNGGG